MAILLLAIILLAITTCVYMFWITFSFNGQFYNGGAIDSITMYMQENGHIKLLVIMILAIVITLLFIVYAIKDSKRMASPYYVVFEIAKSELSKESKSNLAILAEIIKTNNLHYTITGYADEGTGTESINQRLSRERAQAVYDCLVNEYNVPASMLKVDYKGGVGNMFYDDPSLSRAVITRND